MFKKTVAPFLALMIGLTATASYADDAATQTQACGGGDPWQRALDPGIASQPVPTASCADPTRIQVAGGCCEGHGGPAGCDTDTHRVLCADGKKSKSCSC
jgi:hypothetical protein